MSFLSPTAFSGAATGEFAAGQIGWPGPAAAIGGAPAPAASRDTAIADISSISSSLNLLAQASGTQRTGDPSLALTLTLPPLPQMPATPPPQPAPTDDHGSSNVVFSDPDAVGDLIH